jgi:phosphatidylinositol glycan class K
MVDTCQANTLYERLYSPNVLAAGSSRRGQNSYSHHADGDLGVAVIDRFTYYTLDFMERHSAGSRSITLRGLFDSLDPEKMNSDPGVREDLFRRPLDKVRITDFFGNVQGVELTLSPYPIAEAKPTLDKQSIQQNTSSINTVDTKQISSNIKPAQPLTNISTIYSWLVIVGGLLFMLGCYHIMMYIESQWMTANK